MNKIELLPIYWFGNKNKYFKSVIKIVTVGLNPSAEEFRLNKTDEISLCRFPGYKEPNELEFVLNNYFEKVPYKSWFSSYEPILNGLGASYYESNVFSSIAIHTDICSPYATIPTWSKLSKELKVELYKEGIIHWQNLIKELHPDVLIISVAEHYIKENFLFKEIFTSIEFDKKGNKRKHPYFIKKYEYTVNNVNIPVIFGPAAQKPFGLIGTEQKRELGKLIFKNIKLK
jgi:hypothetical protein